MNLHEASLENAVKFIASRGANEQNLVMKRRYRTSGQKGVWSFRRGERLYKRTPEGWELVTKAEGDGDDGSNPEVLGGEGLQAAIASEEDDQAASEDEVGQAAVYPEAEGDVSVVD